MRHLIPSENNAIELRGAIGSQKFGIVFWQKTGFLRHCNHLGFQSMITLIHKKFSPTDIQNHGEHCFIQFDHHEDKVIYLALKKESDSKHYFIYGEAQTVYTDAAFHILTLNIVSYISKQIGCKFFVNDATGYLEHRSLEKWNEYTLRTKDGN